MSLMMNEGHSFPVEDGFVAGWIVGSRAPAPLLTANQADDPRWDSRFPDHPLSRCRQHLEKFQQTIRVTGEMRRDSPFRFEPERPRG